MFISFKARNCVSKVLEFYPDYYGFIFKLSFLSQRLGNHLRVWELFTSGDYSWVFLYKLS